jgi:hypothetical protein
LHTSSHGAEVHPSFLNCCSKANNLRKREYANCNKGKKRKCTSVARKLKGTFYAHWIEKKTTKKAKTHGTKSNLPCGTGN